MTDRRERRAKREGPPMRRKFDLGDCLLQLDTFFSAESAKRHLAPDERAVWFGVVDLGVATGWGRWPPRRDRLIRIELKKRHEEKDK